MRGNALSLGIGPIKIPRYLDREQLVTRISQNRFAIAENDRWAEPLEENFSRVLSENLSILLQIDRVAAFPW
ncbi:MAG TPA: PqiC family protein, partial [Candidatus Binatia bacterium]|nr:PqiC family protein [Candidatus Binatia bacterium]